MGFVDTMKGLGRGTWDFVTCPLSAGAQVIGETYKGTKNGGGFKHGLQLGYAELKHGLLSGAKNVAGPVVGVTTGATGVVCGSLGGFLIGLAKGGPIGAFHGMRTGASHGAENGSKLGNALSTVAARADDELLRDTGIRGIAGGANWARQQNLVDFGKGHNQELPLQAGQQSPRASQSYNVAPGATPCW